MFSVPKRKPESLLPVHLVFSSNLLRSGLKRSDFWYFLLPVVQSRLSDISQPIEILGAM